MNKDKRTLIRPEGLPESASWPVVTPIMPSVVYASETPDALDDQYEGRTAGYTYAREGHPNADLLARRIDTMEDAKGGIVLGSGMAAVTAVMLGLLKAGDHVVGGDQLYGRSLRLMGQDLPRMGVATTLADPTDAQAIAAAIRPETRMILVELVSNPTLRVADMAGIAAVARDKGVLLVVDNTFTTPRAFKPFAHGADIVIHSVTKLLAGHSDVTLGYAVARDPQLQKAIYDFAVTTGMTPSPFDCWLAERGLATFDLRFDRAEATAVTLADHLAGLPGVRRVLYPMRSDHPDAARAQAILGNRGCNMVSFELEGGRAAANAFARAAEGISFAPTLGDVGTTLSHPASSSHRALTPEGRAALGIGEGFFRVSVGLEEPVALCAQFTQAVSAARGA
ncbi:aminotransferase class I/II-fold pyridoxal phosphate-dependent enzyme [Lutimaribacter sp. EGI FJ00015]|uniref:Aminotransferase class I/II-fold pyridoxal phosphate-dependent enzyme n=1 Tax=Lutimaribacter degradans TaxID=2945989 RepID=A0ACC5ZRY5_9RHOB|nr:aminotransferase class I/II-fold pyridoxal phosphate-dependent enzyme [Lutimaribacter sp. EGI FJ00013]MCM2561082.1 aminotransferase class I/II-fold pyridoxal phosphate-dependent enzyme [Lutimaribacter sp. EGI FJ00013]MCO0611969.1 aminotransferase class I/II-fold pyridoxal phosphate-dependent enzyme [Lutimaribacter sp. EGI FJ00015]MCO0634910.1 aminotransferase class I/II-fold pyridoxal phosphate-dependent enzyme [Lutimaribacter sp. EGI FJ00014]